MGHEWLSEVLASADDGAMYMWQISTPKAMCHGTACGLEEESLQQAYCAIIDAALLIGVALWLQQLVYLLPWA